MEKISTLMKKMNVLELIEQIVELTNDQGITTEKKKGIVQLVSPAKPYLKELMNRLGIADEMEAMFLAVFVDQCNDTRINMKDIARHFDVRIVKILSMANHIDSLVRRGIIMRKKDSDGDITYRVPNKTIECLRNGTLPKQESIDNLTTQELYDHIDRLLARRDNEEIEDSELYLCIDELIEKNPQIELTKRLCSFNLSNDNLKLYLVLCRIFINDHDDRICRSDIRDYFETSSLRRHVADLTAGTHELMKQKLVEHSFEDGQADSEHWRLTDYSKREVLSELKLNVSKDNRSNLTRHDKPHRHPRPNLRTPFPLQDRVSETNPQRKPSYLENHAAGTHRRRGSDPRQFISLQWRTDREHRPQTTHQQCAHRKRHPQSQCHPRSMQDRKTQQTHPQSNRLLTTHPTNNPLRI